MSQLRYEDSKFSLALVIVVFVIEGIFVHNIVFSGVGIINVFFVVILFVFCLLFFSISIQVTSELIYISYGIGLFDLEIELHEITGYKIGNNRNLLSWMYNPFGQGSLTIMLRSGGKIHLPTDNPKLLQQVTQSNIKKR